jgi:DNA polymerase III sliding clamp (beta) subunit (PCNA family)
MKFILPLQAVINAQHCVATNDIRHYLEGFHVTKTAIESTNGHYLYQAKLKGIKYPDYLPDWRDSFELPDSMIINMKQTIKAPIKKSGCQFVTFEVEDSKVIATTIDMFGKPIGAYLGEVVDGRFPDTERVIPKGDPEPCAQIGFNSAYLKKVDQVSEGKFSSVKLKTYGEHKAAIFEIMSINDHYSSIFVLMPIRL